MIASSEPRPELVFSQKVRTCFSSGWLKQCVFFSDILIEKDEETLIIITQDRSRHYINHDEIPKMSIDCRVTGNIELAPDHTRYVSTCVLA